MPLCRRRWSALRGLLLASCVSAGITLSALYFSRQSNTRRTEMSDQSELSDREEVDSAEVQEAISLVSLRPPESSSSLNSTASQDVHAFYYPWYGDPEHDGRWLHWNHELLPHWDPATDAKYPKGHHFPPDDIGANFFPELGPYSVKNPFVIDTHMRQMRDAGVGVAVVSWFPPGQADKQGKPWDALFPIFLDAAARHGLSIAFHIEPFDGRSAQTLFEAVKYIVTSYGHHPAFYRRFRRGKRLPLLYFYDSYQVNRNEWLKLLSGKGEFSVRNTPYDCIAIGLVVNLQHVEALTSSKFDGYYTYFASNGFSYGSSWKNWRKLSDTARRNGLIFIPSVGPGYIDTRVRLWNDVNTKERSGGKYYESSWRYALNCNPEIISITSFNEWHEGTQIEPAVPKTIKLKNGDEFKYCDYEPENPSFYLNLTRKFVSQWQSNRKRIL